MTVASVMEDFIGVTRQIAEIEREKRSALVARVECLLGWRIHGQQSQGARQHKRSCKRCELQKVS